MHFESVSDEKLGITAHEFLPLYHATVEVYLKYWEVVRTEYGESRRAATLTRSTDIILRHGPQVVFLEQRLRELTRQLAISGALLAQTAEIRGLKSDEICRASRCELAVSATLLKRELSTLVQGHTIPGERQVGCTITPGRMLTWKGKRFKLTPTECDVLTHLLKNSTVSVHILMSRTHQDAVWREQYLPRRRGKILKALQRLNDKFLEHGIALDASVVGTDVILTS